MVTLFDVYTKEEIEKIIKKIDELIENGAPINVIIEKFSTITLIEELIDLALTRKRFKEKGITKKLYLNSADFRFSTPKIVADYRADRLKCNIIADLGCGTGMQTFSFAKKCKKVYAVEIDKRKITYAKENAKILGIKNIEFIQGDVLDRKIIKKIKDAEIFFSDPSRLPSETERKIETIIPNPNILLKRYPERIAIEFPPQIKNINFDCEREYISIKGVLNRLTLYFNDLKKNDYSAVVLPSKTRIEGDKKEEIILGDKKGLPLAFIYEIDQAVVKAGLVKKLIERTKSIAYEKNMLTSHFLIKNPFFKNTFKVLEVCHTDFKSIIRALQKHNIGEVVIRYKIEPHLYWKTRKDYEKYLTGKKTAHLFIFEKAIVAEKI
ncbi:MAG: methyltransferase domain-containing protein [Candidatus Woesearchaeota archaeon]